jgi:hypothetical protein
VVKTRKEIQGLLHARIELYVALFDQFYKVLIIITILRWRTLVFRKFKKLAEDAYLISGWRQICIWFV